MLNIKKINTILYFFYNICLILLKLMREDISSLYNNILKLVIFNF